MIGHRSLRNHLAHELMESVDATDVSWRWERMRWSLDQAQLVLDFIAAHPVELAEWLSSDLARCR